MKAQPGAQGLSVAVGPQPQLAQEVKGAKEARLQSYAHVQGHLLEAQVGAQALSVAVVGPQSQAAQPHLRKTGAKEALLQSYAQQGHLEAQLWAQALSVT